jgi:hypothetical protein
MSKNVIFVVKEEIKGTEKEGKRWKKEGNKRIRVKCKERTKKQEGQI